MQTENKTRSSRVQSTQAKSVRSRYEPENLRQPAMLLGALCILLPPVGILLTWRSSRMTMKLRCGLTAVGFASMCLIFALMLKPSEQLSVIKPAPVVPQQAGYGAIVQDSGEQFYAEAPQDAVPASPEVQPGAPADQQPEATDEPGGLTMSSTVYAVTNNASSYHLQPVCGMQENHRELTLEAAMNEGLVPCEICIPDGTAG